jgi:hypothetical protein
MKTPVIGLVVQRKSFAQARTYFATVPLGIVYFLLTPQVSERKISATFPNVPGQGTQEQEGAGKIRSAQCQGVMRAIFARMDCSMHQSRVRGSRPLVASC